MGKSLPEYSLEEILSVLARSILANDYYEEDYELLKYVADDFYTLREEGKQ